MEIAFLIILWSLFIGLIIAIALADRNLYTVELVTTKGKKEICYVCDVNFTGRIVVVNWVSFFGRDNLSYYNKVAHVSSFKILKEEKVGNIVWAEWIYKEKPILTV